MSELVDADAIDLTMLQNFIDRAGPGPSPLFPDGGAEDAAEYTERLARTKLGLDLPPGYVPSSTYWLIDGDEIVGVGRLRHRLTPALERNGGHVGGAINPGERGRGLGNDVLRLTLARSATELGLSEALVTTHASNAVASRSVVSVGGELINEVIDGTSGRAILRFRFRLRPTDGVIIRPASKR